MNIDIRRYTHERSICISHIVYTRFHTSSKVVTKWGRSGESEPSSEARVSPRLQAIKPIYIACHCGGCAQQSSAGTAPVASTYIVFL